MEAIYEMQLSEDLSLASFTFLCACDNRKFLSRFELSDYLSLPKTALLCLQRRFIVNRTIVRRVTMNIYFLRRRRLH